MSFAHSPKIVTDGLVLSLDAGNTKSYPGSGTAWFDKSGFSNNGTLTNGPTFNSANLGSIVFDGVDDYVALGNATNVIRDTSAITVESWVRTNVVGSYKKIIITGPASGQGVQGFYLSLGPSPSYIYFGVITNLGTNTADYASTISTTRYNHIVGTYDSSSVKLYLNGTLVASSSLTGNIATGGICRISGYSNNNEVWNGDISNIKIYSRALSAAEISQNYNTLKGRF